MARTTMKCWAVFSITSGIFWCALSPFGPLVPLAVGLEKGLLTVSQAIQQVLVSAALCAGAGAAFGSVILFAIKIERSSRVAGIPLVERWKKMGFFLGSATSAATYGLLLSILGWLGLINHFCGFLGGGGLSGDAFGVAKFFAPPVGILASLAPVVAEKIAIRRGLL